MISDSGNATPAISVARMRAQEQQHHQRHQHDAQHQRELHIVHRGADGHGAVADDGQLDARRNGLLQFWNFARGSGCTTSMTLAPGWRWISMMTAGVP